MCCCDADEVAVLNNCERHDDSGKLQLACCAGNSHPAQIVYARRQNLSFRCTSACRQTDMSGSAKLRGGSPRACSAIGPQPRGADQPPQVPRIRRRRALFLTTSTTGKTSPKRFVYTMDVDILNSRRFEGATVRTYVCSRSRDRGMCAYLFINLHA